MNHYDNVVRLLKVVQDREQLGDTEGAYEAYSEMSAYLSLHVGGPIIGRMFHMRKLRAEARSKETT